MRTSLATEIDEVPEGDTIWRTASRLRAALEGREVQRLHSPLPAVARRADGVAGARVSSVEPRGKNLLIRFDGELVLYTHMRMSGAWHLYRPGERWAKPERQARVTLDTDARVAVCFNAPVVELLTALELRHHRVLSRLGEDVLSASFDREAALTRLRGSRALPIGEALMRQDLVAGIGNVYKSEVLFECGVDPLRPVAELRDETLATLLDRARKQMGGNLGGWPRRTRPGLGPGRHWVYGRRGRPCRRCGTPIEMRRQGAAARSTYFCPACQAAQA